MPTPACLATASRLASGPPPPKTAAAASRRSSRLRTESEGAAAPFLQIEIPSASISHWSRSQNGEVLRYFLPTGGRLRIVTTVATAAGSFFGTATGPSVFPNPPQLRLPTHWSTA